MQPQRSKGSPAPSELLHCRFIRSPFAAWVRGFANQLALPEYKFVGCDSPVLPEAAPGCVQATRPHSTWVGRPQWETRLDRTKGSTCKCCCDAGEVRPAAAGCCSAPGCKLLQCEVCCCSCRRPLSDKEIAERVPQVITCSEVQREVTLFSNNGGKTGSRTFRFDKVTVGLGRAQTAHSSRWPKHLACATWLFATRPNEPMESLWETQSGHMQCRSGRHLLRL